MSEGLGQLVERYLADEMSQDERARFERRALEDAELANLLYEDAQVQSMIQTAASERLRLEGAGRSVLGDWLRRWLRLPVLRWAVPAAATAVIALVLLDPKAPEKEPHPVFRGDDHAIRGISPSGIVDRTPTRFVWTSSPDAESYRFELFDSLTTSVFATVTVDTSIALDPEVAVPRRGHWMVTPLGPTHRSTGPEAVVPYRVSR